MGTKEWQLGTFCMTEKDRNTITEQSRIVLGQHLFIENGD